MAQYTVIGSVAAGAPWSNEHGQFQTYTLTLEGVDKPADLNQKVETAPPAIGSTMDLTLTPDPKYPAKMKAKKVYVASGAGSGGFQRSPEESAKMQRQHSQEMALRYAAIRAEKEMLPEPFKLADLKSVIDWFEKDIADSTALRAT
jgi:hypothetical protein